MAYDKSVPFSFTKNGIYYFERRIPSDLRGHYQASKISYSLRTRSAHLAASRAIRAGQQLDEYWYHLRIKNCDIPGRHRLRMLQTVSGPTTWPSASDDSESSSVKLSEAVAIYLRLKGENRPVTFSRAAERACGYIIDVCADKDLLAYRKADATRFRGALIERGLTGSSITRVFGTVGQPTVSGECVTGDE